MARRRRTDKTMARRKKRTDKTMARRRRTDKWTNNDPQNTTLKTGDELLLD
jgi:hypothetical protein